MKKIYQAGILLLFAVTLSTCKKGPDDPFISLKSRTTRLAGTWHLQSGSASYTKNNSYNESYTFDGKQVHENVTSAGGPLTVYYGTYFLNLTISKNGTFTLKETITGSSNLTMDVEGTWSFNSGIGEDKKREDVEFFITKVNSGAPYQHIFNRYRTNFFYKLTDLRDKKMVLHSEGKSQVDANSSSDLTTDYTFIQ